jgi:hypothetical protein
VKAYAGGVRFLLTKLLLLLAMLLMPFGMAAAPASTAHHASAMDMPMGHCPDGDSSHHSKAGIAECTMACAAALPAVGSVHDQVQFVASSPAAPRAAQRLNSLHPETATPPPKDS